MVSSPARRKVHRGTPEFTLQYQCIVPAALGKHSVSGCLPRGGQRHTPAPTIQEFSILLTMKLSDFHSEVDHLHMWTTAHREANKAKDRAPATPRRAFRLGGKTTAIKQSYVVSGTLADDQLNHVG